MKYNYLIVGAGISGAIWARELTNARHSCLVIDKRPYIGGLCHTRNIDGIDVHYHSGHIFHTNIKSVWDYVNKFGEFSNYHHKVKSCYKGKLYSFPINLETFQQFYGIRNPQEAKRKFCKLKKDLFNKLYAEYSYKQWGMKLSELGETNILQRLPIRFTFNDDYFSDKYQGIPVHGYTRLIERIFNGVVINLNTPFEPETKLADKVIYTGSIDEFFNYSLGKLQYRSIHIERELHEIEDYQGCATINYADKKTRFLRIVEHKHFNWKDCSNTIISKDYPVQYNGVNERYYPIPTKENIDLYNRYTKEAEKLKTVIFSGRMGLYKYMNMDETIIQTLNQVQKELNGNI